MIEICIRDEIQTVNTEHINVLRKAKPLHILLRLDVVQKQPKT